MDYTPSQAAELIRLIPGAIQQAMETEQAIAILDVEADIKQRVHLDGKDALGNNIGQYSTTPGYFSVEGSRKKYGSQVPTSKLRGRGKNKRGQKFANGNPRKSMYFEEGYSGFRRLLDRPTDKVNLKFTGNMTGSIASGSNGNVATIAFTNPEASELARAHEERYDVPIFEASGEEIDRLGERLEQAARRAIDELLP